MKRTIKIVTPILFVALIASFIAFKAGKTGSYSSVIPLSPNGGVVTIQPDSTVSIDTFYIDPKMSSSKSIVILSKEEYIAELKANDSIKKLQVEDSTKTKREFMGSSKSRVIFEPQQKEPKKQPEKK